MTEDARSPQSPLDRFLSIPTPELIAERESLVRQKRSLNAQIKALEALLDLRREQEEGE